MARRAMSSAVRSNVHQRAGRGQGVLAARADRGDAVFRLQHVADAGDGVDRGLVGDDQHGLQPAQVAVGAPVLGQVDAGPGQLLGILLQLGLQPLDQGEGVGGGAGEAGQHLAVGQPAHLAGVALDDGRAHGDLAVAGDHGRSRPCARPGWWSHASPGKRERWTWHRRACGRRGAGSGQGRDELHRRGGRTLRPPPGAARDRRAGPAGAEGARGC